MTTPIQTTYTHAFARAISFPSGFKGDWTLYYTALTGTPDDEPVDLSTPAAASAASHNSTAPTVIDCSQGGRLHVRARLTAGGSCVISVIGWGSAGGDGHVLDKAVTLTSGTQRDAASGNYITASETYDLAFMTQVHVFVTVFTTATVALIDIAVD